jgi:hypothetical protein
MITHGGAHPPLHRRHPGNRCLKAQGQVYFAAENPVVTWLLHPLKAGSAEPPQDPQPLFLQPSSHFKAAPGHMVSDILAILGSPDFVYRGVTSTPSKHHNHKKIL